MFLHFMVYYWKILCKDKCANAPASSCSFLKLHIGESVWGELVQQGGMLHSIVSSIVGHVREFVVYSIAWQASTMRSQRSGRLATGIWRSFSARYLWMAVHTTLAGHCRCAKVCPRRCWASLLRPFARPHTKCISVSSRLEWQSFVSLRLPEMLLMTVPLLPLLYWFRFIYTTLYKVDNLCLWKKRMFKLLW